MIVKNFQGYIEGADLTTIPAANLCYPSKNVLVTKGIVVTRGGIVNDGTEPTEQKPIHSEFVWKDAVGGVRPLRVFGNTLQVKYKGKWYTLFTGLDADTARVIFATWVDGNGAIIKKRLFFVDGSTTIYQWNGAIAEVDTANASDFTIAGGKTAQQLGFDKGDTDLVSLAAADTQFDITNPSGQTFRYTFDGTGTNPSITAANFVVGRYVDIQAQNFAAGNKGLFKITGSGADYFEVTNASGVVESNKTIGTGNIKVKSHQTLLHFIGSNTTANSEEIQTSDITSGTLTINGTFDTTPVAGDVIMAQPTAVVNKIADNFDLNAIYTYKNHVIVANYSSVNLYWSHISTYSLLSGLDFTMPSAGSRTALTPIFMTLDAPFTAMIARKNVLWVSDADDWYKCSKSLEVNAYGLWVDIEKFETGERKGALPMAVVSHKGDIIYMGQDKSLQRITTVELLSTDEIKTISDDVEALFRRLDPSDVRLYYYERAIYVIFPAESTMLILDMIEGYYQPPQILPINCMSVIDGVKYGHHNDDNQTYELFSGNNDLDTEIESIIAFPYVSGKHDFRYKKHTQLGISCRLTGATQALVDQYFEEDGARDNTNFEIDGAKVKTFTIDDDVSYSTHPYAERSWGGADMVDNPLKRAMVFDKFTGNYFDYRMKISITGKDAVFHLLGWEIDDEMSAAKIDPELYITKS